MGMNILHVVGARPNFMKAAPLLLALGRFSKVHQTLVHTGQHYDPNLSEIFFRELEMPAPDINLEVGSGTHAHQTAQVMTLLEPVLLEKKPEWVVVYGDVNSTLASTLVCSKLQIKLAHVEAGLRSFDRTMPEEINRLVTDQLSDLLFTPSADADENLLREGIAQEKIRRVGNIMIDSLVKLLPQTEEVTSVDNGFDLSKAYGLVTLHRPANVDVPESLTRILSVLSELSQSIPLFFPMHPRTQQQIKGLDISLRSQVKIVDPVGYVQFLALQRHAAFVVTDSGGVQEETTYLGVPCLTLRENTERPVTVEQGTNTLVGNDLTLLESEVERILDGKPKKGIVPALWDGRTGGRIASLLSG